MDPLARLFGSSARIKLLRLFLFNDDQQFSVADAAYRTKTPKDTVRREITSLVSIGVLNKRSVKGKPCYTANQRFAHHEALYAFLRSTTKVGDKEMVATIKRAGTIRLIVLSGLFSGAVESKADLLIVGDRLDEKALEQGVRKLEAELGRELRYAAFSTPDFRYRVGVYDRLVRDVMDFPNRILLDKIGIE